MGAATNCAAVDDVPGLVCQAPKQPQARGISRKHCLTCVTAYSKVTPVATGSNPSDHLVSQSASDRTRGAGSYRNQQVDEPHRDGEKGGRLWWQARRESTLRVRAWQLRTRQPERTTYHGDTPLSGVVSPLGERLGVWLVREGSAQGAAPLCGRESNSRS